MTQADQCEHLELSMLQARFEPVPGAGNVSSMTGQEVFNALRLNILLGEGDRVATEDYLSRPEIAPLATAVRACVAVIEADDCPKWVSIQTDSAVRMIPRDLAKYYTEEQH